VISNGPLLLIQDLSVAYGGVLALQGISMEVHEGEIVTLIGANGAGKSTLLRAISGITPIRTGRIFFDSMDLGSVPAHDIVKRGVAHVPEGRGIFANLTVQENLKLSTWSRKDRKDLQQEYRRVFDLFPRLAERQPQLAGTLSGGEQQMLAIGRGLMLHPRILMLDEPSMGLAPVLVELIFSIINELNKGGTTILLVEQNARMALSIADRGYVLQTGEIVLTDTAEKLKKNEMVQKSYLGIE
jgi:branched-chain amino acid transport system ATP-binding protein